MNEHPRFKPPLYAGGILWGFFCETSLSMKIARLLVDGYIWIFTRIHFFHPNFPIPVANIFIAAGCDVVAFIQFFLESGYPGTFWPVYSLAGLIRAGTGAVAWCSSIIRCRIPGCRWMPWCGPAWFCIARPGSCRAAFFWLSLRMIPAASRCCWSGGFILTGVLLFRFIFRLRRGACFRMVPATWYALILIVLVYKEPANHNQNNNLTGKTIFSFKMPPLPPTHPQKFNQ